MSVNALLRRLPVTDIHPENLFLDAPLPWQRFDAREITARVKPFVTPIRVIKDAEIARMKDKARRDGITFDDNGAYALRRIDVSRREGMSGQREPVYTLVLEPTSYYDTFFPNAFLDKRYNLMETGKARPLREWLGLEREKLHVDMLDDLMMCQFKIATTTLVITRDNYLLCSVRSRRQAVARAANDDVLPVHASTAEGMYRSRTKPAMSDRIGFDGRLSPFATAWRSLEDELGLEPRHYDPDTLHCLGYFMDTLRAQPLFVFRLDLDLDLEQVFGVMETAPKDVHENQALFAVPASYHFIEPVFEGALVGDVDLLCPPRHERFFAASVDKRLTVASNHAGAAFATLADMQNLYVPRSENDKAMLARE